MNPRTRTTLIVLVAFACVSTAGSGRTTHIPDENPRDLKRAAKWMNQGQVTLFQAIRIAEERTGGRAVTAKCELHHIPADDPVHDALETPNAGLMINVCCVADDKIIDVKIDARHRKIVEMKLRCLPRESLASNPGNLQ